MTPHSGRFKPLDEFLSLMRTISAYLGGGLLRLHPPPHLEVKNVLISVVAVVQPLQRP